MVLAGFSQRVGCLAAPRVLRHAQHQIADGNFVVGERCRGQWIDVYHLFPELDTGQIVAFQIARTPGPVSAQIQIYGRLMVLEVRHVVIDDFAPFTAHQHAVVAYPVEILRAGEVHETQLAAKVEPGEGLRVVRDIGRRGGAIPSRPIHQRRSKGAGIDRRVFKANP